MAYPNQRIDMEIPYVSRDYVILPDTIKLHLILTSNPQTNHVVSLTPWLGYW